MANTLVGLCGSRLRLLLGADWENGPVWCRRFWVLGTAAQVAAWSSECELAAADDPAWTRYVAWRRGRAQDVADPLVDLLSGAWQAQVLA